MKGLNVCALYRSDNDAVQALIQCADASMERVVRSLIEFFGDGPYIGNLNS